MINIGESWTIAIRIRRNKVKKRNVFKKYNMTKDSVFMLEDHYNNDPFDHFHNQEKHIWQNEKTTYYVLLVDKE